MTDLAKKILIIDPDQNERMVTAAFLKSENYAVEAVNGLAPAIKKLSDNQYFCLLLDVDLPEMQGYDAVPILKNLDARMKIIMTSKNNSKELEAKVREQDIFFYFIKSFGKDELKMAIKNAFEK